MQIWNITKESYKDLLNRLEQSKENNIGKYVKQRKPMEVVDGIATINICGPLVDSAPEIYAEIGCTDYRAIIADIAQAEREGAKGILLRVDSGGGSVKGNIEASRAVQNVNLPVVVSVDGLACSAAYKISSGADVIVARESAIVGNIGSVLVWMDDSKMLENFGITINAISNDGADLKTTFHAGVSEEQLEFLQESINAAGKSFQNHVLENRTVDKECFRAGWYSGQKAIDLGLIDHIGDEDLAREILANFDTE